MRQLLTVIFTIIVAFSSCEKKLSKINENPFEKKDSPLKLTTSDHADTVFINWSPATDIVIDKVKVTCDKIAFSEEFTGGTGNCILTHVPYRTPISIKIIVYSGESSLTIPLSPNITGWDNTIKNRIYANKGGVSSGDGLYSVALPDGRSIFMMGDSYVCDVTDNTHPKGAHMYRNTYILYNHATGQHVPIYDFNGPGTYSSAAVPPGQYYEQKWYWPGDGYVQGNRLFIFQSLMYMKGEGMWGFAFDQMNLLEYSLPDMTLVKDWKTLDANSGHRAKGEEIEEHYGAAVLNDGEYVYFYAQVSTGSAFGEISSARVARADPENPYSAWEYFDGETWSPSSTMAADMSGLDGVAISSQFEVFKLGDKYILLTEDKRLWENNIYTFVSDSPQGPWSHKKLLYPIPDLVDDETYIYNAMAHPQITKDGMFLISYCVNNDDQCANVNGYRGRFMWIEPDWILK